MEENFTIIELSDNEVKYIEDKLDEYDQEYIKFKLNGEISIGIKENGYLIAGLNACFTAFKILYVSTVFVDKEYRRRGIGARLMDELERKAKELGANMIRLDTFDFQGREFYKSIGYEEVGFYKNGIDCFAESFFVKRLD